VKMSCRNILGTQPVTRLNRDPCLHKYRERTILLWLEFTNLPFKVRSLCPRVNCKSGGMVVKGIITYNKKSTGLCSLVPLMVQLQ
jgi:hypothetical protein